MKTGILVAVSEDGRRGKPVTEVMPYDEALKRWKATDAPADPNLPLLELWVGCAKSKRFKPSDKSAASEPPRYEKASVPKPTKPAKPAAKASAKESPKASAAPAVDAGAAQADGGPGSLFPPR